MRKFEFALTYYVLLEGTLVHIGISVDHLIQGIRVSFL